MADKAFADQYQDSFLEGKFQQPYLILERMGSFHLVPKNLNAVVKDDFCDDLHSYADPDTWKG